MTRDELADEVDHHLSAIEYHTSAIRGQEPDVHPGMFQLPTGQELRQLREECGLEAQEVAERIGCSPAHVSNIETSNGAPGIRTLSKMLTLYRVEWDEETSSTVKI